MTYLLNIMPLLTGAMIGALLMIIVFSALVSKRREERDAARLERDDLQQKLDRVLSTGADLAPKFGWRTKSLMNKPESALFYELDRIVKRSNSNHRLTTQVAFGAFVEATARADFEQIKTDAFFSVQRKVADFLIIDRYGKPVMVIEYQGDGHYQRNAHARDHVKRIVCQMARLPFIEVPASGLTHGQRGDLHRLLGIPTQLAAE
jgi:hypothetical protein